MKSKIDENLSFIKGAVRQKDLAYLILINDTFSDQEHSIPLFWYQGNLQGETTPITGLSFAGICVASYPIVQGIYVAKNGEVLCVGSGDKHVETIFDGEKSGKSIGPLSGVAAIDGKAYAVGMYRQVYRREDTNHWVAINDGLPSTTGLVGFEAIDGFSDSDIYAAGWDGEIWYYDGDHWTKQKTLTPYILGNVCCAGNGKVYITGQRGTIIMGDKNGFELVHGEKINRHGINDDIWGTVWFNDQLYISGFHGVYVFDEGSKELKSIDFGKDFPDTCYQLSVADGAMWSIGAKDIMAFDGEKWVRIV